MTAGEPQFLQANDYEAKQLRQMLAALLGARLHTDLSPAVSLVSAGGGHGIVGAGDLAVSEKAGTPNMSVDVAAGTAFIRGTQGADQGVYIGTNDATVNVVIAAADATNARKDLIVAKVRDAAYAGADNDLQITVIQGTPAGSPVDPTVTEDTLVLARVDVPALDTAITNSQITDLRTRAYALGGVAVCTSTTRPNPAYAGQEIYETDTKKVKCYDGTDWWTVSIAGNDTSSYTPTLAQGATGNISKSISGSSYRIVDGVCEWWFILTSTGPGTAGSIVTVSLPVTAAFGSFHQIGAGDVYDASTGTTYACAAIAQSTTTLAFRNDAAGGTAWGSAPSIALASGDIIRAHVRFPVASAA